MVICSSVKGMQGYIVVYYKQESALGSLSYDVSGGLGIEKVIEYKHN